MQRKQGKQLEKKVLMRLAELAERRTKPEQGACPAYCKDCKNCGIRNHFAIICQQKSKKCAVGNSSTVKALESCEDTSDFDCLPPHCTLQVVRMNKVAYNAE